MPKEQYFCWTFCQTIMGHYIKKYIIIDVKMKLWASIFYMQWIIVIGNTCQ